MALTLSYPTLSTVFDSSEVQTNFSNVSAKFGNIKDSDIATGAAISLSKLAGSKQEVWLQLTYLQDIHGSWPADLPDVPLVVVPLPGSNNDVAWTVTDVSWVCNDTGTTAGAFGLYAGAFNAAGTWVTAASGTIDASTTMGVTDVGDLPNQGRAVVGGTVTLTQTDLLRSIALTSAGAGVAVMDAAEGYLQVTIALSRSIFV